MKKRRNAAPAADFDDSLENAVIDTSDDVDDGEAVRTALSGNRCVVENVKFLPSFRKCQKNFIILKMSTFWHQFEIVKFSASVRKCQIFGINSKMPILESVRNSKFLASVRKCHFGF